MKNPYLQALREQNLAERAGLKIAEKAYVVPKKYVVLRNPRGKRSCKVGNTINPRNWGVQGSF